MQSKSKTHTKNSIDRVNSFESDRWSFKNNLMNKVKRFFIVFATCIE